MHFDLPAADNALIRIFFAAFLLAPVKYITHHARPFHRLTMVVLGLFAVVLFLLGTTRPDTSGRLLWLSLIRPIYYLGMLVYLHFAASHDSR